MAKAKRKKESITVADLGVTVLAAMEPTESPEGEAPEVESDTDLEPEGDESPLSEAIEEAAEGEDPEAPEGEEPAPALVADDALVELEDGTKLTIADLKKELKSGSLRQADYTRKTQALAEDRRKFEGTQAELKSWLANMRDPDCLEAQCLEYWPDTFEEVVERRARELIALADKSTSDRERDLIRREREYRVTQSTGKSKTARQRAVEETLAAREQEAESEATAQQNRKTYRGWSDSAMTSCGLDKASRDHIELMIGTLKATVPEGVELTEDHFKAAAHKIAKLLKVEPPKPEPKLQRVEAKPAAKLPPAVKAGAGKAKPVVKAKKPVGMADYLNSILSGR